jgi:hypothetical protein
VIQADCRTDLRATRFLAAIIILHSSTPSARSISFRLGGEINASRKDRLAKLEINFSSRRPHKLFPFRKAARLREQLPDAAQRKKAGLHRPF